MRLTSRQREVAMLAATTTLAVKQIAARLKISTGTAKLHLNAVYRRLGLDGRVGLVLYFARQGRVVTDMPSSEQRTVPFTTLVR